MIGSAPRLRLYNLYTSVNWGKCLRAPPGTLYLVPVLHTGAPCTGHPDLRPTPPRAVSEPRVPRRAVHAPRHTAPRRAPRAERSTWPSATLRAPRPASGAGRRAPHLATRALRRPAPRAPPAPSPTPCRAPLGVAPRRSPRTDLNRHPRLAPHDWHPRRVPHRAYCATLPRALTAPRRARAAPRCTRV